MSFGHLTDEQFAGLLAGTKTDEGAHAHVESCAACREELQSVSAAVGDLGVVSLLWAERRAVRIETPSVWALNWGALHGWGATLAGVLVLGVALGAHMRTGQQTASVAEPVQPVVAPTDAELAQDNRLLRSIDAELSTQAGLQVPIAAADGASRTVHHRAVAELSN